MSNTTPSDTKVKAAARRKEDIKLLVQSIGTLTAAGFTCTRVEYGVNHPAPTGRGANNYPKPALKVEYGDYSETFDIYYSAGGPLCIDLYESIPETKYKDLPESQWTTIPKLLGEGTITIKHSDELVPTGNTVRQRRGWWKPEELVKRVISEYDSEEQFEMKRAYDAYCRQYAVTGCRFPDLLPTPEPVAHGSKEMPESLLQPPGLVGDVADYTMATSVRPHRPYAIAGALLIVSALSRNRYRVGATNTGLDIQLLTSGQSGSGKDSPRGTAHEILGMSGMPEVAIDNLASGPALIRALSEQGEVLLLQDEYGRMLLSADSAGAGGHNYTVLTEIMSLYGKSTKRLGGKRYAQTSQNINSIWHPFFNLMGSTTQENLMKALKSDAVRDGFLNRLIVVQSDQVNLAEGQPDRSGLHQLLLKTKALANRADPAAATIATLIGEPAQVSVGAPAVSGPDREWIDIDATPEAEALLHAIAIKEIERIKDRAYGGLWARWRENVIKIAGILAVGVKSTKPVITLDIVNWANDFITWCIESLVVDLDDHMADSPFEAIMKKVLRIIKKAPSYAKAARTDAERTMLMKGYISRGTLLRLAHMSSKELASVIETLLEQGSIEGGVLQQGVVTGKNPAYYRAV